MTPSAGDIRCIVFGHLTRMAVWHLRHEWETTKPTSERIDQVRSRMAAMGDPKPLIERLAAAVTAPTATPHGTPLFPDSTRGRVFTLQNLDRLVDSTRLAEFRTRGDK